MIPTHTLAHTFLATTVSYPEARRRTGISDDAEHRACQATMRGLPPDATWAEITGFDTHRTQLRA